MAHKFNLSEIDPYAEAAHEVEENLVSGPGTLEAEAETQAFDALSNAVVTAVGDVAATAFRLGINDKSQLEGLARAISRSAQKIVMSYQGEVDSEPVFRALQSDPRLSNLPAEQKERLGRELQKTRQLEELILDARRLPDLLDFAGQVGLHVPNDVAESGDIVMTTHPTPTAPTAESLPRDRG